MSERPRDPRAASDPAARDDDPARRSAPGVDGAGPAAIPQAAAGRGGRSDEPGRAARERDPRFGLLPAVLVSLVVHVAALAGLAHVYLSPAPAPPDEPVRVWLRGTGARGEPGGGDTLALATPGPGEADATEVLVAAEPAPAAPAAAPQQAAPPGHAAPDVVEAPRPIEDVASVPAFVAPAEPANDAIAAQPTPDAPASDADSLAATPGVWQGPPVPEGFGEGAEGAVAGADGAADRGSETAVANDASLPAGGGTGGAPGSGAGGNGVLAPNPLAGNEPPDYPIEARRAREEGLVVVHAQVAADGSVSAVEVLTSSGHERLDAAALAAVAGWHFEPARRGGAAVAQAVDVPIRFRLKPR